MTFVIVEKKNHLARHGSFDSKKRAQHHLKEIIPDHLAKGYFVDKALTVNDFEIIELDNPTTSLY